jgi:hypothetical protein
MGLILGNLQSNEPLLSSSSLAKRASHQKIERKREKQSRSVYGCPRAQIGAPKHGCLRACDDCLEIAGSSKRAILLRSWDAKGLCDGTRGAFQLRTTRRAPLAVHTKTFQPVSLGLRSAPWELGTGEGSARLGAGAGVGSAWSP